MIINIPRYPASHFVDIHISIHPRFCPFYADCYNPRGLSRIKWDIISLFLLVTVIEIFTRKSKQNQTKTTETPVAVSSKKVQKAFEHSFAYRNRYSVVFV